MEERTGKLPLASRFMALQNRFYDGIRHPRAFEVAAQPGTASDFSGFAKARQCLVVTFRRSGEPVPTPVNFGLSGDGRLYFRSEPHVAKIKRLRRDPHVRVCPCNLRGKPTGPVVEARARVLTEEDSALAETAIAANWRPEVRLIERGFDRIGVPAVYVEVTPERG